MRFLYNIIDVAALNASIVYTEEHRDYNADVTLTRKLFLTDLAKKLIIPHIQTMSQSIKHFTA